MSGALPSDVQVVQDAVAFATAAADGQAEVALVIGRDALALDRDGFLDALASTVTTLADVACETGGDPSRALRELGLGISIAAVAELAAQPPPERLSDPQRPSATPPTEGDDDGQEEQDRP
jgi:hypothetical protein